MGIGEHFSTLPRHHSHIITLISRLLFWSSSQQPFPHLSEVCLFLFPFYNTQFQFTKHQAIDSTKQTISKVIHTRGVFKEKVFRSEHPGPDFEMPDFGVTTFGTLSVYLSIQWPHWAIRVGIFQIVGIIILFCSVVACVCCCYFVVCVFVGLFVCLFLGNSLCHVQGMVIE